MAKRRGNGEGTITQRLDGRWEARVTLLDGNRKCFYGKTRQDVARKLTEARRALDVGSSVIADERLTVAQYLALWLERMQPPRVRPSTHRRYTQLLAHVTRGCGSTRLTRLTPTQVTSLYARLQRPVADGGAGLSATTAHHTHTVLRKALSDAVKLDLVVSNVTDRVDAPKLRRAPIQPFSAEEAQRLLEAACGDRLEALYVLALTTGMRLGELLALTWRHVDLDAGTLQVVASLQRVDRGWRIGAPKTQRSRRQIALTPTAIDALRAHRARQLSERMLVADLWKGGDLVFCNAIGDHLDAQGLSRTTYQRLLRRAGLPHKRFHDLRHTAATLLLKAGIHPKIVSEMLGHSTIAITMDTYSFVMPDMQREAASAMEAMLRVRVVS